MPKRNSNLKIQKPSGGSSSLRVRCWKSGLSVSALARKIERSRPAVYFAWENPTRYPVTFKLIQQALSQ